jgi:hypothetical protein
VSHPPAAGRWTATRVVAVALLVGAALVGLARLPGELSDQADAASTARDIPRIESVPVLRSMGPKRTEFLAYVRRTVPERESVRIVQATTPVSPLEVRDGGEPGVCGYSVSRLQYFWLVYALAPRPSTCDPQARWTVYFGVSPGAVPTGATVRTFAAGYALVRR